MKHIQRQLKVLIGCTLLICSATLLRISPAVADTSTTPGAPADLLVSSGLEWAKVSWAPPAASGSSPIAQYVVRSSTGSTRTTHGSATSMVWIGLFRQLEYRFTVQAINADGVAGPESDWSPPITPSGDGRSALARSPQNAPTVTPVPTPLPEHTRSPLSIAVEQSPATMGLWPGDVAYLTFRFQHPLPTFVSFPQFVYRMTVFTPDGSQHWESVSDQPQPVYRDKNGQSRTRLPQRFVFPGGLPAEAGSVPTVQFELHPFPELEQVLAEYGTVTLRFSFMWPGAVAMSDVEIRPLGEPQAPAPALPVLAWYYAQFRTTDAGRGNVADVQQAAAGGIDALIISEAGGLPGDVLWAIHSAPVERPVRFVVGVEPEPRRTFDEWVRYFRHRLDETATHPFYLRFHGRPVFVFYHPHEVQPVQGEPPWETWKLIREAVDPGRTSLWIAEGGDPSTTPRFLDAFDGLHLYSIAWDADPGRALAGWATRVREYNRQQGASKLWAATVMPGGAWDDLRARPVVRYWRSREEGAYYRAAWEGALATNPSMVIITSFNEVFEGTEIYRRPEWGDTYLGITRQQVERLSP